jgi:hypothetical protein
MELFSRNWLLPLSNKFFGDSAYKQMDIIIRESDNINYQSFISMKEHIDRNFVLNFLITDNNSFMKSFYYFKYIFLLLSYFFSINFIFVDFVPNDMEDTVCFFQYICPKVSYEIICKNSDKMLIKNINYINYDDEKQTFMDKIIEIYENNLCDTQKEFFTKISNIQKEKSTDYKDFVNGMEKFCRINNSLVNRKVFSSNIIWSISMEGELSVDFCIYTGNKKYI